jgi:hypothetical protein
MGGHYYATSTLRDTAYGIMDSFAFGNVSANSSHSKHAFRLLARIVAFYEGELVPGNEDRVSSTGGYGLVITNAAGELEMDLDLGIVMPKDDSRCKVLNHISVLAHDSPEHHLPDLTTFDGVLDLVALFCIIELSNVLGTWSYVDTKNNMERRRMIEARERARRLRRWLFREYELVDESGRVIDYKEEFYWPYLVQCARALHMYKKEAEKQGTYHRELGRKGATLKQMDVVIAAAFMWPSRLRTLYLNTRGTAKTFAWTGQRFGVRKRNGTRENDNNDDCGSASGNVGLNPNPNQLLDDLTAEEKEIDRKGWLLDDERAFPKKEPDAET